jgi:hypothetical protein
MACWRKPWVGCVNGTITELPRDGRMADRVRHLLAFLGVSGLGELGAWSLGRSLGLGVFGG